MGAAASVAFVGHNIISCCRSGEVEKLKELLQHEHANVNCTDADGWTPLMIASKYGNLNCIELLLKYKPDVNQLNYYKHSALFYAKNEHKASKLIVALLESRGAEVDRPPLTAENSFRSAVVKISSNPLADDFSVI